MITQTRLKEVLRYNPRTGIFIWAVSGKGISCKGAMAGCLTKEGYLRIRVDGHLYLAHRLAWLWVNGEFPMSSLDHRNCDKQDNRIRNLRLADKRLNTANTKKREGCYSRFKGVTWSKQINRWLARICIGGKTKHLGSFGREEEAAACYQTEANKEFGVFARMV